MAPAEESPPRRTLSVVIPCLDSAATVERLVRDLFRQALPGTVDLEIIAVDNGSRDDTWKILRRLPVTALREPKRGPAAARNAGVRAARGDVIVFLDSDTRPAVPDLLAKHLEALDRDPGLGISGGAISPDPEQRSWIAFAENATAMLNWHDGLPARALTFQPTANLAFRRALFDRIGPLDERMRWLEDFDWSARVLKSGLRIAFDPKAGVYLTGRESLPAVVKKFYTWGLNVRETYLPGREEYAWLFRERPVLFLVNAPWRALNDTWVTVKRWLPTRPLKTLMLLPLTLLFRAAWAVGVAVGAHRYLRARP